MVVPGRLAFGSIARASALFHWRCSRSVSDFWTFPLVFFVSCDAPTVLIVDWFDSFADHGTMAPGDFSFGDFGSTYTTPTIPSFPESLGNLQPIQPNPQTAYPPPVSQHQPGYVPSTPQVGGEKRKAEPISPPNRMLSFEEASRLAAEEDKRKRNTAASARFRIKKKQREQALEKSAKEMTEKVTMLEGRISALETENKWLKSLVTEKHGGKDDILKKLLKEFSGQVAKTTDVGSKDSDSDSYASSNASSTATDESDNKKSTKRKD